MHVALLFYLRKTFDTSMQKFLIDYPGKAIPLASPTISKVICPTWGWEECFSIDFPGLSSDIILLDIVDGQKLKKGHFKEEPNTLVYGLREDPFDTKIQV